MNRNGFAPIIILLAIVGILVIGGIWYYEAHKAPLPATVTQGSIINNSSPIFEDGYIVITSSSTPNWFNYQDNEDAYHFGFPAPLGHRNGDVDWGLVNSIDGTQFVVLATHATTDPKSYDDKIITPLTTENQTINGLTWTFWTFEDGVGYYIYHDDEAITLKIYAPSSNVIFSESDAQLLKQVVSTFGFDGPSSRMDNIIANLKVGQSIGSLTVSKVIPAESFSESGYGNGTLGKINFIGNLILSGSSVDDSALNGAWDDLYGLDSSSTASLPKIGPIAYNVPVDGWTDLFQEIQLNNVPSGFNPDSGNVITVDNLTETFLPGGGAPSLSADFVQSFKK